MSRKQRTQRGVDGGDESQRPVVIDLRKTEPAVTLVDLHSQRPQLLQTVDDVLGDASLTLDLERVDLPLQKLPQRLQKPLPLLHRVGRNRRLGMDQVQPETTQEQLLAEAGQAPLTLTGILGNLTRFAL